MPDYPPARTHSGSFVAVEVLPRMPERLARTIDQAASWGSDSFEGLRLIAGIRGWIVRCRIDSVGVAPRLHRAHVRKQGRAEQIAATLLSKVKDGAEADDVLHFLREADEATK